METVDINIPSTDATLREWAERRSDDAGRLAKALLIDRERLEQARDARRVLERKLAAAEAALIAERENSHKGWSKVTDLSKERDAWKHRAEGKCSSCNEIKPLNYCRDCIAEEEEIAHKHEAENAKLREIASDLALAKYLASDEFKDSGGDLYFSLNRKLRTLREIAKRLVDPKPCDHPHTDAPLCAPCIAEQEAAEAEMRAVLGGKVG